MRELDDAALERRLRGVLQEHLGALPLDLTVDALDRRREAKSVARRSARGRGITLLGAAALLLVGGALAAGSSLLRLPSVVPPVPDPSIAVVTTASPDATFPSPSETAAPSAPPGPSDCTVAPGDPTEPIGPLAWTPASLTDDWPAPVRPEPAGGGSVQPIPLTYLDLTDDNGSDAHPCVDIRGVTAWRADPGQETWATSEVRLRLDSSQPLVDPAAQWIAYGVVIDDDRDGVPDWRYGIDNVPFDTAEASGDPSPRRWWRTDLHTGRTDAGGAGGGDADWYRADFRSGWPSISDDANFWFGGADETTQGSVPWGFELDMPFYTWASVIVNGRVVATDYAPDAGWLVATPGAKPGGTYLLGDPFPRLSMTVPDGWADDRGGGLRHTCGDDPNCADTFVRFSVIPDPEDPCTDTIVPPIGPSFDDLVASLPDLPQIDIAESTDVTVDGYRGRYIRYTAVAKEFDCSLIPRIWPTPDDVPAPPLEAWILDVDGVFLVIAALPDETPSEMTRMEVRKMVESIHFER